MSRITPPKSHGPKLVPIFASAVLLAAVSVVVSSRGFPRPAVGASASVGFPPPSRAAALQSGRTVEAEVITVTADGFEPAEITRPAGRFLLVVENRSGVESITFHISDEAGELLKQVALPAEKPDWAEELDLPAGRYRLAEAGHPDWSCLITVTE